MIEAAVVDASVGAKWLMAEPDSDKASSLRVARLLAPEFMVLEVASALAVRVRSGTLTPSEANSALALLQSAEVRWVATRPLVDAALEIANVLAHSVYDCVYLALSEATGVPLVTADHRLVRRARTVPRFDSLVVDLAAIDA